MTGRDKIEAAFSPDGTGEFATVLCYEDLVYRDHWGQLTSLPWWTPQSGDLDANVRLHADFISAIGQDWISLPMFADRDTRAHLSIEAHGDSAFRVDTRTGERTALARPRVSGQPERGGRAPHMPDAPPSPETVADVDALVPPAGEFDVTAARESGAYDLAWRLADGPARDRWRLWRVSAPMWACVELWGFEGAMMRVLDAPALIARALERRTEHVLNAVRCGAVAGADGVWIEELLVDMISPGAYRELNLPHVRRIVEEIRSAGMRSIYYFCGNPAGKWELILATGADALAFEESKKGWEIDVAEIAEFVAGRRVVLGNLDSVGVLERGSDDALRAEIARQLDAGRRNGGRFVMSLGSPATPDTPVARIDRYCQLVGELGR